MRYGEITGMVLLTVLVTIGILTAQRFAPHGASTPTKVLNVAIKDAEKKAGDARPVDAPDPNMQGADAAPSGGQSNALANSITSTGYSCPAVRRVAPISGGNGVYRITCADAAGAEHNYRVDTRKGSALPEGVPTA